MCSASSSRLPYIVAVGRTPIGAYLGVLSRFSASRLSSFSISQCLRTSGLQPSAITHLIYGQSVLAGVGPSPAATVARVSKLSSSTTGFSVSQGFCTGLRSIAVAAMITALNPASVVAAIGVESSSNVPYYLLSPRRRNVFNFGHQTVHDGLLYDAFTDSLSKAPLSSAVESLMKERRMSRESQELFVAESKRRCTTAAKHALCMRDVAPLRIPATNSKTGGVFLLHHDEHLQPLDIVPDVVKLEPSGVPMASPADGAATVLVASPQQCDRLALPPLGRILAIAETASTSLETVSEAIVSSVKQALRDAGNPRLDALEVEEAFPAVALTASQLLNMETTRTNCHGGSAGLGIAIGMSGIRNIMSLMTVLETRQLGIGCVVSYDAGGNAIAIVVEKLR